VESAVSTTATAKNLAAATALKAAITTFLAELYLAPDANFVDVALFLHNLSELVTSEENAPTAAMIVSSLTTVMTGNVTAALELVTGAETVAALSAPLGGSHKERIPAMAE
jgi:hypothetical protein